MAAEHQSNGAATRSSQDLARSLSDFFKRTLIAVPLIKKYPHASTSQKCGLSSATLELDTSSFPSIEYIAGTRLSVYPVNPAEHVKSIMRHLHDDLASTKTLVSTTGAGHTNKRIKTTTTTTMSDQHSNWIKQYGHDSLRLALTYLYDITTAPSREVLLLICDSCTNKEHKSKLLTICQSDETWERWLCQSLRTLKSTLEEFNSCHSMSARGLLSELAIQQPRLYSISSIKSSQRFRAEIIVFQHKFTLKHITVALLYSKERDKIHQLEKNQPLSTMREAANQSSSPRSLSSDHRRAGGGGRSKRSVNSLRSVRSMTPLSSSPITTQQVHRVPSFSGPLMSMYASSSTLGSVGSVTSSGTDTSGQRGSQAESSLVSWKSNSMGPGYGAGSSTSSRKTYDGLCSNYLLNLNSGDKIICEFVENPRFTLKGNRERPIIMIGQDVGVVAFRPFWQQRNLEHDRAQIFYTLFKDLSPKKFGDMQLVYLTGNRCKVEELFKREINSALANKIMSAAININRSHFVNLLESAAAVTGQTTGTNAASQQAKPIVKIETKELLDLGNRIAKLLIENNGCLYTCCDPQMTQAIEILTVESLARVYHANGLTKDKVMALLPKWKGRKIDGHQSNVDDKFLFTLENLFERAQIVQEVYDSSI